MTMWQFLWLEWFRLAFSILSFHYPWVASFKGFKNTSKGLYKPGIAGSILASPDFRMSLETEVPSPYDLSYWWGVKLKYTHSLTHEQIAE